MFGDQNDEVVETIENAKWHAYKAVLMLLLGTIIAAVTADPLVDAVENFSTATSIPSFFVSFVILPFASSSEVVSTLIFASKKKSRMASLMYSEVCFTFSLSCTLNAVLFSQLCFQQLQAITFSVVFGNLHLRKLRIDMSIPNYQAVSFSSM